MSKYTTGEIARLCGVSVRTVQYYDERGILIPSGLTDGGRRLYSEQDLKKMHVICFLREAGFPINSINELFCEEHPEKLISILLDRQAQALRDEISESKSKLDIIESIKREVKGSDNFSVDSIGDIAYLMKDKNKLKKMRWTMVLSGLPVTALQWASIILWITTGAWWLFAAWVCVGVFWGIWVSKYYFNRVAYVCPECHEVFRPRFKESFWAYHTPRMRRLTCPECHRKSLCLEIYKKKEKKQ